MTLYFVRINAFNVAFAWLLSLRYDVAAWHVDLPGWAASRFTRLRPIDLFSWDDWALLRDEGFVAWRDHAFPAISAGARCDVHYRGRRYDYAPALWQYVAREFEKMFVFMRVVARQEVVAPSPGGYRVALPWVGYVLGRPVLAAVFPGVDFLDGAAAKFFCLLGEAWATLLRQGWVLARLVASFFQPRRYVGRRPLVWAGISASEVPCGPGRLSFAWAVQYWGLPRDKVLYVLPGRPNAAQAAYLDRLGIAWLAAADLVCALEPARRLRVAAAVLRSLLGWIGTGAFVSVYQLRQAARSLPWMELAEQLGVRAYITSSSYAWPEPPETSALRDMGVRTVIWGYSANALACTERTSFRDLHVSRSFILADEYWVWNESWVTWLGRRRIDHPQNRGRAIPMGGMMCGDAAVLARRPAEVRASLGLPADGFFLGVFDLPIANAEWQRKYGGGPFMIDKPSADAFFLGVLHILETLPQVSILLKPKRGIRSGDRDSGDLFYRMVDGDIPEDIRRRIFLLDADIDPYLPVAAAEAAVGLPFTSPVKLAASSNRHGVYFDPLRRMGYCPEMDLGSLLVADEAALIARIRTWLEGGAFVHAQTGRCTSPAPSDALAAALVGLCAGERADEGTKL